MCTGVFCARSYRGFADIKAENLFLMLDERDEIQSVVVGDFDTAKVISKRNQPTTVRGTPSFIAPEVLLSEDTIAYSSKADSTPSLSLAVVSS